MSATESDETPAYPDLTWRDTLTVDELSVLPADLYHELLNGWLYLPPFTPFLKKLSTGVFDAVHLRSPKEYVVCADPVITIDDHNLIRPAVVVLRREAADLDAPVRLRDAVLVVEVAPPTWAYTQSGMKSDLCAAAGVPAYWYIDTSHDWISLTEFLLDEHGQYQPTVAADGNVWIARPWEIEIDLHRWTARRDAAGERPQPYGRPDARQHVPE